MYISLIKSIRSSLTHFNGFLLLIQLPQFIEITFFFLYQQNKSFESKVKFRQAGNCCKRVLKLPNLHRLTKQESITFQKIGSLDFWEIANSVLNKGKSAIPPLLNGPEVLSSASGKAKLFAENFSKNSNLDNSDIFLTDFPSRTTLKQHNISVIPNSKEL